MFACLSACCGDEPPENRTNEPVRLQRPVQRNGAYLNDLGNSLRRRFEQTGVIDDINQSIAAHEQAIELTPPGHEARAIRLNNTVVALQRRYNLTKSIEDLDRSIMLNEQALASPISSDLVRNTVWNNMTLSLKTRYQLTHAIEDLERLITLLVMQSLMMELAGHNNSPDHARVLNDLGISYQVRYERTAVMNDLDRGIRMNERAVELALQINDPACVKYLDDLGNAVQARFKATRDIDDLTREISIHERTVDVASTYRNPDRVKYLNDLATALQIRFDRTGSMEDLTRAITTNELVLTCARQDDHIGRSRALNNLGIGFRCRFENTGSMEDLDQAISKHKKVVASITQDHYGWSTILNNYCIALCRRFQAIGSMDDLEQAIKVGLDIIVAVGTAREPRHGIYFNNLGSAYHSRFDRTGSMTDLNLAVELKKQAVAVAPEDYPQRPRWLSSLGNSLHIRFLEGGGSEEDLEAAITAHEKAVATTSKDHPDYVGQLNNLAITLRSQFLLTRSIDDLNRAVSALQEAVSFTPSVHTDRVSLLRNLATTLESRSTATAVADDDPDHAVHLNAWGDMFRSSFEAIESDNDLEQAILAREEAASLEAAPPTLRIEAANLCGHSLIRRGDYTRAKAVLKIATSLLSRVSPRELRRSDQQYFISQFSHIPACAVSLCLQDSENAYSALQALELGRGILANLLLEVRSDISTLATSHPTLARQFQELRDKIDTPASLDTLASDDSFGAIGSTVSRRELVKQFDKLLQHIRTLDGYQSFLRGPSEAELRSLAKGGAIVVFNICDIRSDAFLITTDNIRSVHLPLLTYGAVVDLTKHFFDAIDEMDPERYKYAMKEMNLVLQGLWDNAVKLILDELGFTQTPQLGEAWPRVWWVASGLLSLLPIHAAGYHDVQVTTENDVETPAPTVLDRVISSYAFTVKSLSYAAERTAKADQIGKKTEAVLFGMPTTPDESPLLNVEREITDIGNILTKASIPTSVEMHPVRATALSKLPNYQIVHFACHGFSASDPSESSLLLNDWKATPLSVLDLSSLNVESAKFAYLSACHTSATRGVRMLDESINLSSAIQLCGYPSVVGSLWQVDDLGAADVARSVYEWILEGASQEFDARRSAEGLQKAVRQLRETTRIMGKQDPLTWAPFIHVGI